MLPTVFSLSSSLFAPAEALEVVMCYYGLATSLRIFTQPINIFAHSSAIYRATRAAPNQYNMVDATQGNLLIDADYADWSSNKVQSVLFCQSVHL